MNIFHENHLRFLKLLIDFKVEFMLVGGYAVNYYGYRRGTGDMDIWLKPSNDNKVKLINCLKELELDESDLEYLISLNFENHLAFHIDEEPERIDFLTHISGVNWLEAYDQHVISNIENIEIPVIHRNHLIQSKFNTGRLQDQADIEGLQNIPPSA